jgi:hypothetical protein
LAIVKLETLEDMYPFGNVKHSRVTCGPEFPSKSCFLPSVYPKTDGYETTVFIWCDRCITKGHPKRSLRRLNGKCIGIGFNSPMY